MEETDKPPVRAIAYTRVSRAEQAKHGVSLEAQRRQITQECARRGWELLAVFEDAGRSGKAALEDEGFNGHKRKGRPGTVAALTMLRSGQADVLVVVRLDRLSRRVLDMARLAEELQTPRTIGSGKKRQTLPPWKLVSLYEGDTDVITASGGLNYGMRTVIAQYERHVIGERIKAALAIVKGRGVRLGRGPAPLHTRRRIVALRESGLSWPKIADWLNAHGVKTTKGGAKWYASSARY